MEGKANLKAIFFVWWYGEAYASVFAFIKYFFIYLSDLFSVKICLKTLFYPWKRDLTSYAGLTIQQRVEVLIMNLVSRLVGAIIKIFTLVTFLITTIVWFVVSVLVLIVWFTYPLFLVALIAYGIRLILTFNA